MKKLIAMIMICVMLCPVCALAAEGGTSFEASMEINGDLTAYLMQAGAINNGWEVTDGQLELVNALIGFINKTTFYAEAVEDGVHVQMNMGEFTPFSLDVMQQEEDQFAVLTSLLPGYAITGKLEGMENRPSDEEKEQAEAELKAELEKVLAEVKDYFDKRIVSQISEPFTLKMLGAEMAMSRETEYLLTVEDLMYAAEKLLSESVPLVKEYLAKMGLPEEAVSLRWNVTPPEDPEDLQLPISVTLYQMEDENGVWEDYGAVDVSFAKGELSYRLLAVCEKGNGSMSLTETYESFEAEVVDTILLEADWTKMEMEGETDFDLSLVLGSTPVRVDTRLTAPSQSCREMIARLFVKDEETPLVKLNTKVQPIDSLTVPMTLEEKIVLDMGAELDEQTSMQMTTDFQMGFNDFLVTLIQAAPDEMKILLNLFVGQQYSQMLFDAVG